MDDANATPGFDPNEKVAVITGAAGGIGLGMARAFSGAGMSVVLADLDAERVEAAAAELTAAGHSAIGVATDVSKIEDVQALADAAMDTHGRVDVLCNNAGVGITDKLSNVSIEDWEWAIGIDLWGPIYGVKVFQPLIEQSPAGRINSTASISGLVAGAAAGPYNVAKHGVVALMATLEREFRIAKSPHRASCLCPGPINTNIGRHSVKGRRAANGLPTTRPKPTPPPEGEAPAAQGNKLAGKLSNFLETYGMDPDAVGELVLEALMTDQFWVFTHPKLLSFVEEQNEALFGDRSLSKGKLV